jgi:hypothetical protein
LRSVLIDTNTLVLLIAGSLAPDKLGGRRLREFDLDDLLRLREIVSDFQRHVTLPNILTEASNLLGSGSLELVPGAAAALALYCQRADEVYLPSVDVILSREYQHLGLTDGAIHRIADPDVTVLTTDHRLYGHLTRKGLSAINLMHFKTPL